MIADYDAVVIGSGAGGGAAAAALVRRGMRVVVLEKGPRYDRRDYVHDEVVICRRDFFQPAPWEDPHVVVRDGVPERSTMGWTAVCVGGGTVHMAGYFYRMLPDDFRLRSRCGVGFDWPLSYEELEPHYAAIEWEIGVSGSAGSNPFEGPRSRPYPLPPIQVHPTAAWIDEACGRLGLHSFPDPRAILSAPYGGRAACVYCDFCGSYGCEVGAKSSAQEACLPGVDVIPRAMVFRLVRGPDGRVREALYYDEEGRERSVRARHFLLAAGAIETARLLLLSDINPTGEVGRNLQFSSASTGSAVYRLGRRERDGVLLARSPFLGRSVMDFYWQGGLVGKGGTIRFGLPHANPIFSALKVAHGIHPPRWGEPLLREMRRYWHETRTIEFETFADYLPNEGTFVALDPEITDPWDLPSARIHLEPHPHHEPATRFLMDRGLEVLAATGADEVLPGAVAGVTPHLIHGTCRMGADDGAPADRDGRLRGAPNLFVVDGAALPVSSGVPSTLTIMANARRIASAIGDR